MNFDRVVITLFYILILVGFTVYITVAIYRLNVPLPDQNITFNVVGVINSTDSSLVNIQFECIKFCGSKDLVLSSNDKVKLCWQQCGELD